MAISPSREVQWRWIAAGSLLATLVALLVLGGQQQRSSDREEPELPEPEPTPSREVDSKAPERLAAAVEGPEAGNPTAWGGAPWTLIVQWQDGEPVQDASILLCADKIVLTQGRSSSGGRLEFESRLGAEQYFVLRGNVLLHRGPVPEESGTILSLPLEETLEGLVLVDGRLPSESLELAFQHDAHDDGGIPDFLAWALNWRGNAWLREPVSTRPDGSLRVAGLPAGRSGYFLPPVGFAFLSGGDTWPVTGPGKGHVLELTPRPAVTGRVVDAAGNPIEDVHVSYELTCERASMEADTRTGRAGLFRIPLTCGPVRHARLHFRSLAHGIRTLEVAVDPERGRDVGDVLLEPARPVTVRVVDDGGRPLEGAVIETEDLIAGPTGPDGLCTFSDLPPEPVEARASCLRYSSLAFLLPAAPEDRTEIVLARGASLEIHVLHPEGRPLAGVELELRGQRLFQETEANIADSQVSLGASPSLRSTRQHSGAGETVESVCAFRSAQDGTLLLTGLAPLAEIRMEAFDAAGGPLGWTDTVRLEVGEWRRLDVVLANPLSELAGRLVGEDGGPLPGSKVRMLANDRVLDVSRSGLFRCSPLRQAPLDLLCTAPGHAARLLEGVRPGTEELLVVLARGQPLTVHVVDPRGASITPDRVALALGQRIVARTTPDESGGLRFEHAPTQAHRLEVVIGGCRIAREVQAGAESARIEVPTPSALTVRWPEESDLAGGALRLEARDGRDCMTWHTLTDAEIATREVTLRSVLPGRYLVELVRLRSDPSRVERVLAEVIDLDSRGPRELELR